MGAVRVAISSKTQARDPRPARDPRNRPDFPATQGSHSQVKYSRSGASRPRGDHPDPKFFLPPGTFRIGIKLVLGTEKLDLKLSERNIPSGAVL